MTPLDEREQNTPFGAGRAAMLATRPAVQNGGARSLGSYPSLSVTLSIGITLRPTEPSVPSVPDWRLAHSAAGNYAPAHALT